MKNILRAKNLTKRFGKKTVLEGLDLDLEAGCVTVLIGANGSGKSTLLKLALGVLRPEGGSMEVLGEDPLRRARTIRRRVGFVPSAPDPHDWMTPADLLRFLRPQYPSWDDREARDLTERLGVPATTPLRALSRGEGMKTMLVAALAPRPELLLLDEPFAGLDPLAREEVLRSVVGAIREEERTVLCATHDLDIAARIADRVAVLASGRIVEHGRIEAVLGQGQTGRMPERLQATLAAAVEGAR